MRTIQFCINTPIEQVVDELYNGKGAIAIPNALLPYGVQPLLEEINTLPFTKSIEEYLKARQQLSHYYFDGEQELRENYPNLFAIKQKFDDLYEYIGLIAGFTGKTNETRAHRYDLGSIGITPHRDQAIYKNLIGFVVLEGEAEFGICKKRKGENKEPLWSQPRTLILMRAPRCKEEYKARPFHYVGEVTKKRITLGFRYNEVKA